MFKTNVLNMKKRGQMEILGAIIVLIVVAYAGYFLIQERNLSITGKTIQELPKYVGNIDNKKVCLTSEETIRQISPELRVFFTSLEQANQLGFIYSKSCE